MTADFFLNWIATTPNFAAPLLLASLGLIICERAGVINLGAEGLMAGGAMIAVIVSFETGNPWLGLLVGVIVGAALASLFAIAVVVFHANQVLAGLAIVALGAGFTGVIGRPYVHQPVKGLNEMDFGVLSEIPWLGRILFSQDPLVYLTVALTVVAWWIVMRTNTGLRLRAVGEDPATADVSGVRVAWYRLGAVVLSGAFCGLAGAYLSLASSKVWVEEMIAGRGWIAVALVIFAQWHPLRALVGALVFGAAEALSPRLLATGADVPVYLMMMLPYVVTLAVLVGLAVIRGGAAAGPSALGLSYLRQDRH